MIRTSHILIAVLLALAMLGCDGRFDNMNDQPRYEPMESSDFLPRGTSAQHSPEGTVPVGDREEVRRRQARIEPPPAPRPYDSATEMLEYGQERYRIWCTPCHGLDGYGEGMVVRRGYPKAASFHTERLRNASDQYIHQVIVEGLGKMPPYGPHVPEVDRRAIIAYLRALQLSQHAPLEAVPSAVQQRLLDAPADRGPLHGVEENAATGQAGQEADDAQEGPAR